MAETIDLNTGDEAQRDPDPHGLAALPDSRPPPLDLQTPPTSPSDASRHEAFSQEYHHGPMPATVEDCEDEEMRASRSLLTPTPPSETPMMTSISEAALSSPSVSTTISDGSHASSSTATYGSPVRLEKRPIGSPSSLRHEADVFKQQPIPRRQRAPSVLSYMDPDSPAMTPQGINEAFHGRPRPAAHHRAPSMNSRTSSMSINRQAYVSNEDWVDGRSHPSRSPGNRSDGALPPFVKLNGPDLERISQSGAGPSQYMETQPYHSPDMFQRGDETPRFASGPFQQQFTPATHMSHVQRQDMIPLRGSQLRGRHLAGAVRGPPVKPIYRRFDTLRHRLLLYLQDELAEMEEQLRSIDTTDTHSRRGPGGIFPASRRGENLSGSDAATRKQDLLGHIGYKIHQYNQVLSTFKDTQELPRPTMAEIHDYKEFLASSNTIVEEEALFLEHTDELVQLDIGFHGPHEQAFVHDDVTPMPRAGPDMGFPPDSRQGDNDDPWRIPPRSPKAPEPSEAVLLGKLAAVMSVALVLPILLFILIPGLPGRMAVVVLVGVGVGLAMLQLGLLQTLSSTWAYLDCVAYAGIYGGVMTVVASAFR